jgi:outer membrane immunogenic protein
MFYTLNDFFVAFFAQLERVMKAKATALGAVACICFLGGSALAADLPMKGPAYKAPAAVPLTYNWTGFYVGGNIGWGWEDRTTTNVGTINGAAFPAGTTRDDNADGFIGGVQLGYDWQFAPNWLLGVAGDFDWSDIKGSGDHLNTTAAAPPPGTRNLHINYAYQWLASLTGRVGYVANNWLLYFKGGAAWAHRNANSIVTNTVTGATVVTTTSAGTTVSGWTIGGGAEWQFVPHWSVFLEYDYVDLGTKTNSVLVTFAAPGAAPVVTVGTLLRDVDAQLSLLKFGINYRF